MKQCYKKQRKKMDIKLFGLLINIQPLMQFFQKKIEEYDRRKNINDNKETTKKRNMKKIIIIKINKKPK